MHQDCENRLAVNLINFSEAVNELKLVPTHENRHEELDKTGKHANTHYVNQAGDIFSDMFIERDIVEVSV